MSVSVTMGLESSEYGLSFNTGCLTYEIFNESNKGYLLAVISYRRLMKLLLYSSQRVAEGINFLNRLSVTLSVSQRNSSVSIQYKCWSMGTAMRIRWFIKRDGRFGQESEIYCLRNVLHILLLCISSTDSDCHFKIELDSVSPHQLKYKHVEDLKGCSST